MDSILADVQDQIIESIRDGMTDSGGDQHMKVEFLHSSDEFEIAEDIDNGEWRVGRIPHALVYVGTASFAGQDSTRRLQQFDVPVRVFVATANTSIQSRKVQHRMGGKWSTYVAAALAGVSVETEGSNLAYLEDVNVESIVDMEEWSLWEVRMNIPLNLDTDVILAQLESE